MLGRAITAATATEALVTIGIKPTWACPSYGYIERGARATLPGVELAHAAYEVERFREKPSSELADQFLDVGGYSWNAGIFIWSLQTVIEQLAVQAPELAAFVSELRKAGDIEATVAAQFPALTAISIDYALLEKAERVLNIEATFDWDDVGSWLAVADHLTESGENNRVRGPSTLLDSENNIIFNARDGSRIALLGVDDLIIVQTDDALLVANRHQADAIKQLVKLLPKELR